MGLDQFLYGIETSKYNSDVEILEELTSFRKSNWLHRWVEKIYGETLHNNAYYPIDIYDLEDLLKLIDEVLKNHEMADEKLPTMSGFFFGSIDYDEYYFKDLEVTKKILNEIILNSGYKYFLYQAWW